RPPSRSPRVPYTTLFRSHLTRRLREEVNMGRLLLKFDDAVLREVSLGSRAVTIGRAPDNDIPIDNLAVSNYHARIYAEAGRLETDRKSTRLNSSHGSISY